MDKYFQAIEAGVLPVQWRRPVTDAHAIQETLFLGLRLNQGVDWDRLKSMSGNQSLQKIEDSLRELGDKGLAEWRDSIVRLTPSGMLLSNEVFQLFV